MVGKASMDNPEPTVEIESRDLQAGDTVGGTYCILSHLGRGGMGHVYEVEHIMLRQTYALKILTSEKPSETGWRRFQTEARSIAKLDHPNIVKVHNLGIHNEKMPYYVMDLLEGETLSASIRRLGRINPDDAIDMFIAICDGLSYAHSRGIVHRDIKPSNIMLILQKNRVVPKLVDFGLVKLVAGGALAPSQQLTASGEVFGSPLYMSPEQRLHALPGPLGSAALRRRKRRADDYEASIRSASDIERSIDGSGLRSRMGSCCSAHHGQRGKRPISIDGRARR
jgi:eukaryotic-like serine/threonine-protein kinase